MCFNDVEVTGYGYMSMQGVACNLLSERQEHNERSAQHSPDSLDALCASECASSEMQWSDPSMIVCEQQQGVFAKVYQRGEPKLSIDDCFKITKGYAPNKICHIGPLQKALLRVGTPRSVLNLHFLVPSHAQPSQISPQTDHAT
jgi:hypothetical protein